jgi:Tol biopolymer transport system component
MQAESVRENLTIVPALPGSFAWQGNSLIFTPEQAWPAGTTVQIRLATGSLPAHFPALPMQQETTWSFSVRQPHLLYLYPAEAPANIYLYDPGTNQSVQLTNNPLGVYEFDVNSNGTVLYYSARNAQGGSDLHRLEINTGSNPPVSTVILECQLAQCRSPRISANEDTLAFERTAPPGSGQPDFQQVWYMPTGTTQSAERGSQPGATQPILAGDSDDNTYQPDWSPEGVLNFYDFNQQATIFLDPKTGDRKQFPNRAGEPGNWDPDGKYFVAPELFEPENDNATRDEFSVLPRRRLMRYDWQSGEALEITLGEDVDDAWPAFSADGAFLAFTRRVLDQARWSPGRQIWVMRNDGSDALSITDEPDYNHYNLAWSPAGDRLAYVRFNQTALVDQPEIWLIDLTNRQSRQLIPGGYAPHWIP